MINIYRNIVNTEYKTPKQNINKGSFAGLYTISPIARSATITDAIIQSEISSQITAGRLPAPQLDSQNNPVTYYAVFFPPGISINDGAGSVSCVDYCAYHGTVAASGSLKEYYYGVHPDLQSSSGCYSGCGTGNVFQNYCSVASHELTEMITGKFSYSLSILDLLF